MLTHKEGVSRQLSWDGNLDGATKYSRAPDDNIFKHAASFTQFHGKMKPKSCWRYNERRAVVPLWGGMQDWHYVKTQTLDITIEVNDRKWPLEDTNLGELSHALSSVY